MHDSVGFMVNNSQTLRAELDDKEVYYIPYIQDYNVLWSLSYRVLYYVNKVANIVSVFNMHLKVCVQSSTHATAS